VWSRLLGLFGRRHLDGDLEQDIQTHLDLLTAQYISEGMTPEAARGAARRAFGGVEQMKEVYRDHRGFSWIEDVQRDFRYALRSLSRHRSFAAVVVLTLGVGIAANTAVFSVVNAVVLRPLKTADGDRLVRSVGIIDGQLHDLPGAPLKVWKDLPAIFEDVSAHRLDFMNLTGGTQPEQVPVARVSDAFFRLFHAPVIAGRTFTPTEDRPNGAPVAVLSFSLWQRRFHGDRGVIGNTITLGRLDYVIVGVVGADFESEQFEPRPELWLPLQADPEHPDGASIYYVAARLRAGVTEAQANAALAVAHARAAAAPGATQSMRRDSWIATPLRDAMVVGTRSSLNLLLGAVGLLLVIACANVANLLLVRADVRQREMTIRAAIGASRGRIARQLLIENLVLSSIGGAAGLIVGVLATRVLLRLLPSGNPFMLGASGLIPRIGEAGAGVTLDWRVAAFVVLMSASTGIIFGLVPTRHIGREDLSAVLQRTSTPSGGSHARVSPRALFVIGQLALSVVIVIGAALLIRTSFALRAVDPGFTPDHVLTMRMVITGTSFETRDGISRLAQDGIERVQAIPGVARASTTCCMPLETVWQLPFVIASRAGEGLRETSSMRFHGFAGWTFVSPGYFDVFGVRILRGRDFSFDDAANAPGVVIINEAMARRYWPNSDPLRDQLTIGRGMRPAYDQEPVRRIIGIVGNIRDQWLRNPARPAMYVPVAQEPDGVTVENVKLLPLVWIVRTTAEPYALSRPIQQALESGPGRLPVTRIRALTDVVSESTARSTFNTWLMAIFATCALGLVAVGIYGLMSYWVQQRTREIGVRIALGAEGRGVAQMVVRHGMRIAAVGIAIGLVMALAFAQVLAGMVFGVAPRDPFVFVGIAVLLGGVAFAAVSVPALRASRVDPLQTLRAD
jgi:predicted permease